MPICSSPLGTVFCVRGLSMSIQKVSTLVRGAAGFGYEQVIDDICDLNWTDLTEEDLISVAWAYYHFSVQFRECLEIARKLYPDDDRLLQLDHGERDTDNLSPWPGVAAAGEKMNHDEFMRRTLELATIPEEKRRRLAALGQAYLTKVRAIDRDSKALALASYEDGGLEKSLRRHPNSTALERPASASI